MDTSEIISYVQSLALNSYGDLTSMTVLYLDYLLTLPGEVEYIWPGKWNHIKLFFFISRYTPFIDGTVTLYQHFVSEPSSTACTLYFLLEIIFVACGILAAEALLLFRTYAIWNNSKRLQYILITLILALSAPIFYNAIAGGVRVRFAPNPIKSNVLPGCYVTSSDHSWLYMFALFLFYETVIFVLTVYKALQDRCFSEVRTPLYSIIYRDGMLFYACLLGISITNIIVMLTVKGTPSDSITLPHRVLHSILSARLILHLRQAADRKTPENSEELTTIAFSPVQAKKPSTIDTDFDLPDLEFSKVG